MDCDEMLQALAQVLGGLFPGRRVYVGEIPQGADNSFSLAVTKLTQTKALGNRLRRCVTVEVRYVLASRSSRDYLAWAETMLDNVRLLCGEGWMARLDTVRGEAGDSGDYFAVSFDVELCFREKPAPAELMETLYLEKYTVS